MKFGEFEGFDFFWARARKFWAIGEALRFYRENEDAWAKLEKMEKEASLN